jgi:hypothetical protein
VSGQRIQNRWWISFLANLFFGLMLVKRSLATLFRQALTFAHPISLRSRCQQTGSLITVTIPKDAIAAWLRSMLTTLASYGRSGFSMQGIPIDWKSRLWRWRYPQVGHAHSAAMSTAGGLVFFGDDAEAFEAVDVQAGKPLWHFNTGQGFSASPMSYAIQGKQYVAIAAGSDIFSFSLP